MQRKIKRTKKRVAIQPEIYPFSSYSHNNNSAQFPCPSSPPSYVSAAAPHKIINPLSSNFYQESENKQSSVSSKTNLTKNENNDFQLAWTVTTTKNPNQISPQYSSSSSPEWNPWVPVDIALKEESKLSETHLGAKTGRRKKNIDYSQFFSSKK